MVKRPKVSAMSAPAQKASPSPSPSHDSSPATATASAPVAAADQRARGTGSTHEPTTTSPEADLLAGLWQEALFARLPPDAPAELTDYVRDVENPRRVYAIYRASRRHDFQLLVERYVTQLRNGCGAAKCATATCFTCRKRLAGRAPIRRYNSTSARTLAVYLASQDNPERGLCPYLKGAAKEAPPAVNNLIFTARPSPSSPSSPPSPRKPAPHGKPQPSTQPSAHPSSSRKRNPCSGEEDVQPTSPTHLEPFSAADITVSEKHVAKDYRSFAVATFGTVAFKMLEWLTPQGIDAMSAKISELGGPGRPPSQEAEAEASAEAEVEPGAGATTGEHVSTACSPVAQQQQPREQREQREQRPSSPASLPSNSSSRASRRSKRSSSPRSSNPKAPHETKVSPAEGLTTSTSKDAPTRPKRSPKPTLRSSPPKPPGRRSVESVAISAGSEDAKQSSKSPNINGFYAEKLNRTTPKPAANVSVIGRGVPEIPSKPVFFENVPPPIPDPVTEEVDLQCPSDEEDADEQTNRVLPVVTAKNEVEPQPKPVPQALEEEDATVEDCPLPQSLSRLNVELVDFICDVFLEDYTFETQFFGPLSAHPSYPKPENRHTRPVLSRRGPSSPATALQWKVFNEQSIFHVLSDPHSLIQSFSSEGRFFDSHTLWYCMLRLTRAAPRLVLHSLWMAAEGLFKAPKASKTKGVSAVRHPNAARLRRMKPLSDFEAGCVMSACFHALVATAPLVTDTNTLFDMSRIRSTGLVSGGNLLSPRQPHAICLEYEDVFSNDLAIRLAQRLCSAISARRAFAALPPNKEDAFDILQPLLDQLDLLNSGADRILEFTAAERMVHETRVPTLLLDWARAVLLNEWNGQPEVANVGPFHGALTLISTMYENKSVLLLGDIQFRVDYFSERLDAMEIPIAWTEFVSAREQSHLLDHPYLFSPEALVTFFRSINFARMSRTYEESSSLKTRMKAIVEPGSLITNAHHKVILQDMLRTASSKYLVLHISRDNVLRDAFDQLWRRQQRELLRPLKVHLGEDRGEEGFDSGGVQQEFFRMAIAECLDPRYGAFTVDERTRMAWFAPSSVVEEWKFELMGVIMSLAVFNGLTLPVTFPKALYRKLLGQPVEELYHIADGWPELASGLMTLLEWNEMDGAVEDVFSRTYEFSVPVIGANVTRRMTRSSPNPPMWPAAVDAATNKIVLPAEFEPESGPGSGSGPGDPPLVTNDNRDEYVSDYIRYLTDVSVRPQFLALERGFRSCLVGKSLSLLTPQILQSVVEGVQEIDIPELRRHARYVGWDASHHTVRDFWSVVKRFDERMKRKLLEFVTASDRVPVGGMRNIQFVVQKNGEEEGERGHLPTAYTCFGTLLLPEYGSREVLRERLAMALENAQGFGFA